MTNIETSAQVDLPRVTVVMVSTQKKMDTEDQDLLGAIKSYEEQDYAGPNDLNLILAPNGGEFTHEVLQAVGVKNADPSLIVFFDDETACHPSYLRQTVEEFTAKNACAVWVDNVLTACTSAYYMTEVYEKVMKSA